MKSSGAQFALEMAASLALVAAVLGGGWWWNSTDKPKAKPAPAERLQCKLPVQGEGTPHPGMVWVPGGAFPFGDTVYPEEQPVRLTTVAGFWLDRTEVTNDEFAEFVKETGYVTVAEREIDPKLHPDWSPEMQKPGAVIFEVPKKLDPAGDMSQWWRYIPGANWRHPGGPGTSIKGRGAFPVVTVTLEDARAYAKWKGRDLPTEAEWEWAARAAKPDPMPDHEQPADANTWQGPFPMVNSATDGFVGLAPVGCYSSNALGLYDMIGNVWELTSDKWQVSHQPDFVPHDQMPEKLRGASASQHVIKGGSYLCAQNYCMRYRAGSRQPQDDDLGTSHLGFRTVLRAAGP